jgi:hypothetical protein
VAILAIIGANAMPPDRGARATRIAPFSGPT